MNPVPSNCVVVGVDESSGARAALDWAAEEALLRGVPLRVAHTWYTRDHKPPEEHPENVFGTARPAALFLTEATEGVHARHLDLDVAAVLLSDAPADALAGLAKGAGLLVVGRRGRRHPMTTALGSVGAHLVAHAPVPVVVVPEPRLAGTGPEPVVVGVGDHAAAPVAFAFAEAEARRAPLLAVRAWTLPNPYVVAAGEPSAGMDATELAALEAELASARRAWPSVTVTTRVTAQEPEQALVEASAGAALVVVGRHHRHGRHGLPLGRVPRRVLQGSTAPVAVVPS